MKKVLHIGCNAGSESMPKYFREQCEYTELRLDGNLIHNIAKEYVGTERPDIIFLQIQSDKIDGRDTNAFIGDEIRHLKEAGAFVINWTGDMRDRTPRWMIEFSHNVNITMFSNWRDVYHCEINGIETGFLQQGIDTDIFTPLGHSKDNTPEIVFLANNYGNQFPLSSYRKSVVQTLRAKFGHRFKVYGNGWGNDSGNVNGNQRDEAAVYRGCKIAISVSHYNSDGYFSDRLGRALCSGAFVLSHDYEGLERDFQPGKHLDTFDNLDELVNKCNAYLDDVHKREQIAKEGMFYASDNFSYQNIVKQILKLNE